MPNRDRYPAGVRAGSTRRSPTPRPPPPSTAACSDGSWKTGCRRTPGRYFEATLDGGTGRGGRHRDGAGPGTWKTYIAVDSADAPPSACGRTAGRSSASRSTSSTPAAWRSSPTPRARSSASGRPGSTPAPSWSTRPAAGTGATSIRATSKARSASTARSSAGSSTRSTSAAADCDGRAARLRRLPRVDRPGRPRPPRRGRRAAGLHRRDRLLHPGEGDGPPLGRDVHGR